MEAGDTDTVITRPQHPYTRLLIDSIPWPDVNRKWGQTEIKALEADSSDHAPGCRFLSRCPFAMEMCRETPPLFRLGKQQAVSCYLHEKNPQIASERLSELLS